MCERCERSYYMLLVDRAVAIPRRGLTLGPPGHSPLLPHVRVELTGDVKGSIPRKRLWKNDFQVSDIYDPSADF